MVKIDENNKKRILKEKEKEHIYRNLNGDLIKAKNEAIIGDNGKSVLLQEEKEKKNTSEGSSSGMENDYKQNIVIENGSLLKSTII